MQVDCGASYAFASMGSLEGAYSLAYGKLSILSEQNIIDCSGSHFEPKYTLRFQSLSHPQLILSCALLMYLDMTEYS